MVSDAVAAAADGDVMWASVDTSLEKNGPSFHRSTHTGVARRRLRAEIDKAIVPKHN